jgi:DmsE family decaheme c-type cytochrome
MIGLAPLARADADHPKIVDLNGANNPHHHFDDANFAMLRDYAQQIGAQQPKLASLKVTTSPYPHFDDPEFAQLRDYAQQISGEYSALPNIAESSSADPHFDIPEFVALREYAQQIGAPRPASTSTPPIRIAEANSAFEALRDFLGRGSQPNSTQDAAPPATPNAKPKPAPRAKPRPAARPAAPRPQPPVFVNAHFVGSQACFNCHAKQSISFGTTLMGRIAKNQPGRLDCESCHGPGSEHIKAVGCAACHGEGGITRLPGTPSLVGQDPQYLVPAMKAYQNGQRRHELMRMVLTGVSEGELHNIAAYYARQFPGRAETPLVGNPGPGRGATGVCAGCHGEQGISVDPAWPSLAGQDAQYLADAMRAYKHGSRSKVITCAACHGAGGVSRRPGMPSLVGQTPEYLVEAMHAYMSGDRKHGLMHALVSGVSDSELNSWADYYAGQTPARARTPLVGDPSAGRSAAGVCVGCHGSDGGSLDPAWPSLAGQDSRYLANMIEAYKDGSRDKVVACAACHGERGISKRAGMPSLVGLDPQYLVAAMKGYTNGQRKGEVMKALLTGISEAELNRMANYYAQQTPARAQTPSVGDAAAGKAASAACAGCHGDQGVSANPAWPSLAGQDARYLASAMKAYKDGSRTDETMRALAASVDDRAINDIAAYYASLRPAQPTVPRGAESSSHDPVVVANGVVASLDSRTIDDVASYFASLEPSQPEGGHSGGREPVVVKNSLLAGLDDRTINNVASWYATLRPAQPPGARIAGGPVPLRVGLAVPVDGSSVGGIISFRKDDPSRRVEDNNAICLNCHERGQRTYWAGSVHDVRGVACSECHTLMKNVSARHQLKTAFEPNTCFQCHKERQAQLFRSSHMPVREGKIVCSNCHNPHGSATEGLLWETSINDNCYKCHAEKRGPFLFEHAPVRENCLNCHDAHGSINEYSLKMSRPRLCYECHTIGHGQAGTRSFDTVSRSCQNCHTLIHGSNSPAGAVFQR